MAVIVPLLRLALVFLNVYETFKTLKPPRVSSRSGQPSNNARMQRKRDMKGCVTVWLVWCSFTLLERIFDGILSIFVPFYNEFKALLIIFQLVFRAAGAKPIYLHVMRPLIKPYVATCDIMLDLAYTFGDFAVLLMFIPLNPILAWWNPDLYKESQNANAAIADPQVETVPVAGEPVEPTDSQEQNDSGDPSVRLRTRKHGLGQGLPPNARPARTRAVSAQSSTSAAKHQRQPSNTRPGAARYASANATTNASGSSRAAGSKYEIWRPPVPSVPADKRPSRIASDSRTSSKSSTKQASSNVSREDVNAEIAGSIAEASSTGSNGNETPSGGLSQTRRTVSESHHKQAEPARYPKGYAAQTLPSRNFRRGGRGLGEVDAASLEDTDFRQSSGSRREFIHKNDPVSGLDSDDEQSTPAPRERGRDHTDRDGAGSDDSTMDGDETLKTVKANGDDDVMDVDIEDDDSEDEGTGRGSGQLLGGMSELVTYIRLTGAVMDALSPTTSTAPWDEGRQFSISSALTSTSNEDSLRTISRKGSDSSMESSMMTGSDTGRSAGHAEDESDAVSVASSVSAAGVKRTASTRAADEARTVRRRARANRTKVPASQNRASQRIQAKVSSGSDKSSKTVPKASVAKGSENGSQQVKRMRFDTIKPSNAAGHLRKTRSSKKLVTDGEDADAS